MLRVCFLVVLLSTITVRVDPEIKRRMKRFSYINWSEVVRRAILERLRRTAPEGWSSVEVIRGWRRAR